MFNRDPETLIVAIQTKEENEKFRFLTEDELALELSRIYLMDDDIDSQGLE